MPSLNAAETCATPISKGKKDEGESQQKTNVPACPVETAAQALNEFDRVRKLLADLQRSAPFWACAARNETTPCSAGLAAHTQKQKQEQQQQIPLQTPVEVTETLQQIHTTLEDAQYLLVTCQNAVYSTLYQQASVHPSTAASCGVSLASSPYDFHRSNAEALRAHEAASVPIEMMYGTSAADPESIPVVSGFSVVRDENKEPTGCHQQPLPERTQFEQRAVTRTPNRMRWPATQFCYVVHVEFKRGRVRRFFSRVPVKATSYALVPGDRGYDCGLVIQCALWNPHKCAYDVSTIETMDTEVWPPGNHGTILELIRLATDDEVQRLHREQLSMERLALNTCRDLVFRLNLPMEVLDCEYQYDGTKISFFFDSAETIDFRRLNKELYRIFNARIWMQNTNGAVRNAAPPNATTSRRWRDRFGHPRSDT